MDYTDDVKTALANDGHIDLNRMEWTREPKSFLAIDDIETGHFNRIPLWLFGFLY